MKIKTLSRTFSAVLAFLILSEMCFGKECPKFVSKECNRDLKSANGTVHVYSKIYKLNFMCDTKTDGGGWIIIQRRVNKDTRFDRSWKDYKSGFGLICEDYWLGNENVHRITSKGDFVLRIDMKFKLKSYYAVYTGFFLEGEARNYRFHYKYFVTGNVDNMMKVHRGQQFSTPDRDNDLAGDLKCAKNYQSGWWYASCHTANLNGIFNKKDFGYGVIWETLTTDYNSLDSVEMKIRPM
ncbi:hypothetical protein Btru_063424 [Bulinus truncatus]|nr:hypothetical protein Btru_063424 [Bulinus truncatus]